MNGSPRDRDLARLSRLDEDALVDELGLLVAGLGFGATGDEDRRGLARRWLERNIASLRRVVCDNQLLTQLSSDENDTLAEMGAVADTLATLLGWPVGSTVAAILVKRGLRALCAEEH